MQKVSCRPSPTEVPIKVHDDRMEQLHKKVSQAISKQKPNGTQ